MQTVLWGAAAWVMTTALLPPVINLSWRIGALDIPGEARRLHQKSVPRIGGVAFFASFVVVGFFSGAIAGQFRFAVAGAAIVFAMGLADDLFGLPAWIKFFFQVLAASFSVGGIRDLTWLGAFAAVFWVLLLTNAHNLIDGMDGLFAGTATIESAGLAAAFLFAGISPLLPLLLAAVCLGFFGFNRPPARIFAGDCGSGSVGFLLGSLSLPLFTGQSWWLGGLAPILLMAYPISDVITTVLRRSIRRQPLFKADRGHLHHLLFDLGLSSQSAGRLLQEVGGSFTVLGVLLMRSEFAFYSAFVCLLCVCVLLLARRYVAIRSGRKNIAKTVDLFGKI